MSQIFKNNISTTILFDFLGNICDKTDTHYIFDINAYKRGILNGNIKHFCDSIVNSYHIAKQYYVSREMNYIKF